MLSSPCHNYPSKTWQVLFLLMAFTRNPPKPAAGRFSAQGQLKESHSPAAAAALARWRSNPEPSQGSPRLQGWGRCAGLSPAPHPTCPQGVSGGSGSTGHVVAVTKAAFESLSPLQNPLPSFLPPSSTRRRSRCRASSTWCRPTSVTRRSSRRTCRGWWPRAQPTTRPASSTPSTSCRT